MKKWIGVGATVVCLGFLVGALIKAGDRPAVQADTAKTSPTLPAAAADRLVVHEWGTFTSYSGSDGGRLEFRPLFDDDLPPFVLDRSMGTWNLGKTSYRALVRMETPVTYFYTQQPREVRVRVGFPQGLLTEFYPPVAEFTPPHRPGTLEPKANSSLNWGTVRLIPESQLRPQLAESRLAEVIQSRTAAALPPAADADNHYFYARQTDSALVHVHRPANPTNMSLPQGDFFEKFLFYRGIGDFSLPIRVTAPGEGRALVNNSGVEPIDWLMLLDVSGGKVRYSVLDGMAAGEQSELSLPAAASDHMQMAADLTQALVNTGLYRREAEAMVNTWRSSWFGEEGTRLLYFVPQRLTDELLPLDIQPPPAETVRVLVGRLDLLTPERERGVLQVVQNSATARAAARQQARTERVSLSYPLPEAVRQLGRLAQPALARIRHVAKDEKVSAEAALLLGELHSNTNSR